MINCLITKKAILSALFIVAFSIESVAQEITAETFASLRAGEIASLKKNENVISDKKVEEIEKIKKEYDEITDRGASIAKKTAEIKALSTSTEADEEPESKAEKTKNSFFTSGLSPQEVAEKKRENLMSFKDKVIENIKNKTNKVAKNNNIKNKRKAQAGASETLNGTSESVQVIVESIGEQLDLLYGYLEGELLNIQSETYALLYNERNKEPDPKNSFIIDLCQYSREGCSKGGSIGSAVSSLTGAVQAAKDKYNQGKNLVSDAKDAVNTAKEGVAAVESITSDAEATKQAISGMGI